MVRAATGPIGIGGGTLLAKHPSAAASPHAGPCTRVAILKTLTAVKCIACNWPGSSPEAIPAVGALARRIAHLLTTRMLAPGGRPVPIAHK